MEEAHTQGEVQVAGRIALVVHPFGEAQPAGLGRAMFDLARSIIESDPTRHYAIFVKSPLKTPPAIRGNNWEVVPLSARSMWRPGILDAYRDHYALWMFFSPIIPLGFRPQRSVVVAWDYAYLSFPDSGVSGWIHTQMLRFLYVRAMRKATRVTTISEFTRTETLRLFGEPPGHVTTIPCGYVPAGKGLALSERDPRVPERYLLFLGVIKERKNVLGIVRGYAASGLAREGVGLVLGGKGSGPYFAQVEECIRQEGLSDQVVILGYVPDVLVARLYRDAIAVVYPSLLEGFGLPILEAMDAGVPVITANVGAVAEVARDAALTVDPTDADAIGEAMRRLVVDEPLRQELILKGRERIREFSWERAAASYVRLFGELGV